MRNPGKYIFDTIAIEKECYSLLAFFCASRSIHTIAKSKAQTALRILPIHEQWLIKETLVSIAIKVRMIDDLMMAHGINSYSPKAQFLTIAYPGKTIRAGIREACNKVIHAHDIVYEKSRHGGLGDKLTLHGDRNAKDWIAYFSITVFVRSVCELCGNYSDNWEVSGYATPDNGRPTTRRKLSALQASVVKAGEDRGRV